MLKCRRETKPSRCRPAEHTDAPVCIARQAVDGQIRRTPEAHFQRRTPICRGWTTSAAPAVSPRGWATSAAPARQSRGCEALTGQFKASVYSCCRYCQSHRFDANGKPLRQCHTIPLSLRLLAQMSNPARAQHLRSPTIPQTLPAHMDTVWEGNLIRELRNKPVGPDLGDRECRLLNYRMFSDSRDLSLAFSTDGIKRTRLQMRFG